MGKEEFVFPLQTSRGVVWRWSATPEEYFGFKSRFQVRDFSERGVVVMIGEDGVGGFDDNEYSLQQGGKLLKRRWKELRLMDYIVESPDFAAGNFKRCIEAGFRKMDEGVEKVVRELDTSKADWSNPIMWRACYNSVVVIIAGKEVFMAGGGGFMVSCIGDKDVAELSVSPALVARAKHRVGIRHSEYNGVCLELAESVRTDEELFFYDKYELKASRDECIVVEQVSPWSRRGRTFWFEHGKNWGQALAAASKFFTGPTMHYGGVLLALEHPPEERHEEAALQLVKYVAPSPSSSVNRKRASISRYDELLVALAAVIECA